MGCKQTIEVKRGDEIHRLPCGKCIFCLNEKRESWTFRIQKEYFKAFSAYFFTLTYRDENLSYGLNDATLVKNDLKRFLVDLKRYNKRMVLGQLKRLNRVLDETKMYKIKYFGVGEYGDQFNRPHYHVIVFNLYGNVLKHIEKLWPHGFAQIDICKGGHMHYATGYVLKNMDKVEKGRQKSFLLASKSLGDIYFNNKCYHVDNMISKVKLNGFIQKLPRYYMDKFFTKEQLEELKNEKMEKQIQKDLEWINEKEKQGLDWSLYLNDQKADLERRALLIKKKRGKL